MATGEAVKGLEELLEASKATEEFRRAVRDFSGSGESPLIVHNPDAPAVKVLRVISKLLEAAPELPVNSVNVQAVSGCSDFEGTIEINGGEACYKFLWDCAWRAKQEGYTDHWGTPDQIRAAREFGYQCFEYFNPA